MSQGLSRTISLSSPDATAALGQALAGVLCPGDVILVSGNVGAGKTLFARALIAARLAAAGLTEDIPSPTYTLVQTYDDTVCEIWHADLYRLGDPGEVVELGLSEAFENAICLVEWPDRLGTLSPPQALRVDLSMGQGAGERRARLSGDKRRWAATLERVMAGLRHV